MKGQPLGQVTGYLRRNFLIIIFFDKDGSSHEGTTGSPGKMVTGTSDTGTCPLLCDIDP